MSQEKSYPKFLGAKIGDFRKDAGGVGSGMAVGSRRESVGHHGAPARGPGPKMRHLVLYILVDGCRTDKAPLNGELCHGKFRQKKKIFARNPPKSVIFAHFSPKNGHFCHFHPLPHLPPFFRVFFAPRETARARATRGSASSSRRFGSEFSPRGERPSKWQGEERNFFK